MAEPHLALLVAAIGERAGEQRDLARPAGPEQPPEHDSRRAARPGGCRCRHRRCAARAGCRRRASPPRCRSPTASGSPRAPSDGRAPPRQRRRVRPSSACRVAARLSGLKPSIVSTRTSRSGRAAPCASICSCSMLHECVGAPRQHEVEPQPRVRRRLRRPAARWRADVAEPPGGREHDVARAAADAAAVVEHAIDRRRGNPGLAGHVDNRQAQATPPAGSQPSFCIRAAAQVMAHDWI